MMAFRDLVLVLAMCLTVAQGQPDHSNLDCADSGYCSLGISKFWTGDISTGAKLREMLEAVSFKKELIITSLTAGGPSNPEFRKWADLVVQMSWELETLGFAHFLVVGTTQSACQQLHAIVPHISCVWDETPMPLWGGGGPGASRLAWFFRWKLFARSGRLGYNLMNVDADFVFFRDPYKFLKTGLMSQIKMWCNPEGGGPLHCNGGFTYIQDLKPDGPVAWVFKNLVDEQMWMMDDNYNFIETSGGSRQCHNFDQEMVYDGVKSAFVGRPLVLDSMNECRGDNWRLKNRLGKEIGRKDMIRNTNAMIDFGQIKDERQVALPEGWIHPDYPLDTDFTKILVNRLTVPNMAYGWPAELGGPLGIVPRGNYSAAWIACLKDDCPDCPWWKEERPFKAGKDELEVALGPALDGRGGKFVKEMFWDDTAPVELLGVGPAWLSNSLLGFRHGMWTGRAARVPVDFAMSHLHYWPDLAGAHKQMVRKVAGRFNWTLSALQQEPGRTPYACKRPIARVLALHPSIDLRRTRSMAEFNTVVLGLIQVAHLMHRTVVLPDVPCEAPWLHDGKFHGSPACKAPLNTKEERYRYPSNLPYPVDEAGNLIGGWFRRLKAATQHVLLGKPLADGLDADSAQAEVPEGMFYAMRSEQTDQKLQLRQRPEAEAREQQPSHAAGARDQGQKQAHGQTQGGGQRNGQAQADGGAAASQQQQQRQWWRRSLKGAYMTPQEQSVFWGNQKRFMYSMGYMWETQCIEHIGKPYAMVRAELAYFLTQPPALGRASLQPSEANTLLLPDDSLKQPPLQPDPGPGVILRPDMQRGWSVADNQVLVPVGQVLMAAARHADEPLLYLGHPAALVSSKTRHARGDTHDHGQHTAARATLGTETAETGRRLLEGAHVKLTVDELDNTLADINRKIENSGCGLLKSAHEGGTKLTLEFPQARLALVKDGRVSALSPA